MSRRTEADWDEPEPTRSTNPLSPRFNDDFTNTVDAAAHVEAMRYVPTWGDRYGDNAPGPLECAAAERGRR